MKDKAIDKVVLLFLHRDKPLKAFMHSEDANQNWKFQNRDLVPSSHVLTRCNTAQRHSIFAPEIEIDKDYRL
jgi:hypothetical protein